jgi:hypothetical protein
MAKVDAFSGLYSLQARGKFGKPNKLGTHWLGWTLLGDDCDKAGYYQHHWNQHQKYWNRSRFYWNPPHTTGPAMALKGIFANGVTAWKALTDEQKLYYNKLKYPARRSGFNRFMREYLKSHLI